MISVIVPVYNTEKYLRRCVDSILAQTFTDFELLLINDGSTDTSGAICKEYANNDRRVRFYDQPNGGVTSARRLGVEHSQGEYISFIDSDDYIRPYYLSDLYNGALQGGDIIYACSGYGVATSDSFIKWLLHNVCDWGLPYKLYRRILFTPEVLDIPRDINVGEDLVTNIKICMHAQMVICVKSDGYIYYMNPNSATHTRKFSLDYEERFMNMVECALGNRIKEFEDDLWVLRMRCWKNMVLHGIRVPRSKTWVQWVLQNKKGKEVTIGDKILLTIPAFNIVRPMLRLIEHVKSILRS